MKKNSFIGKNLEEAKMLAAETLKCKESEFFFNEIEIKSGIGNESYPLKLRL